MSSGSNGRTLEHSYTRPCPKSMTERQLVAGEAQISGTVPKSENTARHTRRKENERKMEEM